MVDSEQVRRPRTEAVRERVLQAAMNAIAAEGYQGCSLARIAAEAGLSNAGLLHHFPSKEHLLVAVLDERDRLDTVRFGLAEGGFVGLAALDRLTRLVEHNALVPRMVQVFTVLSGESVGEQHPAKEWFQRRYERLRTGIAGAIRTGIGTGEIQPTVDCDVLAAEILAMMDGLQIQWLLDPERFDMVKIFADYIATITRRVTLSTTSRPSVH